MKGFIEVTDYDGGSKVLVPVAKITGVVSDFEGNVFIEMGTDRIGQSSGVLVTESFDEVKKKLCECAG